MILNIVNLGLIEYKAALDLQYALLEKRKRNEIGSTLLLLEHPHVLTLGKRGSREHICADILELKKLDIPVIEVNRGGDITYHGPGQIVGYAIFHASDFDRDITGFVKNISSALIELLKQSYGIEARAERGKFAGVWVGEKKIAAIGIAIVDSVTMHGFAFNVNTDLEYFDMINPCGLSKGVTSIKELTGKKADMKKVCRDTAEYFARAFGCETRQVSIEDLLAGSKPNEYRDGGAIWEISPNG